MTDLTGLMLFLVPDFSRNLYILYMMDNESGAVKVPERSLSVTVVAIICALFVFVLARSVDPMTSTHPAFQAGGDHLHYIAMAEEPGGLYQAPFCYRILTPTIVRLMPFGLADSFYFLSIILLVGTGVLVYYIVFETVGNNWLAMAGIAIFYSLSAGAKFCIYDFWLTEPALFFFGALSLYFLLRKHDIWFSITLAVAVLAKESALFLLPLAYTIRAESLFDRKAATRALAVSVLPVAVYLGVRAAVPSLPQPSLIELFSTIGVDRLSSGFLGFIRGGTVGTWGVLILALLAFSDRKGGRILLRALPFLILVYLQPLFAKNVDRLLVLAFIAMIPAAVESLRYVTARFRLTRWMAGGYIVIPFILTALKSGYNSPSPEQQLAVLAGWTIIVAVSISKQKKKTGQEP